MSLMNELAVELNNVSVRYSEHLGLDSVSLKVKQQECIAIVGPNGAGKTTLLTAINRLGRIVKGEVRIFGKVMDKKNIFKLRKEIGFVPQNVDIDARLPISVREVVRLGRAGKLGLLKQFSKQDRYLVDQNIDFMGIRHLADSPIGYLSGGEQKKVALARALVQEPRILLLDEPLSSLDIKAKANMLSLIEKVKKVKEVAVLMVVHDLGFLPEGCNRIIFIKQGKIIFDGDKKSAFSERMLSLLYDVNISIAQEDEHGILVRVKG